MRVFTSYDEISMIWYKFIGVCWREILNCHIVSLQNLKKWNFHILLKNYQIHLKFGHKSDISGRKNFKQRMRHKTLWRHVTWQWHHQKSRNQKTADISRFSRSTILRSHSVQKLWHFDQFWWLQHICDVTMKSLWPCLGWNCFSKTLCAIYESYKVL